MCVFCCWIDFCAFFVCGLLMCIFNIYICIYVCVIEGSSKDTGDAEAGGGGQEWERRNS